MGRRFDPAEVASRIDHCALGTHTTLPDVKAVADDVTEYGLNAACVPRCYVSDCRSYAPGVDTVTVSGFPLGTSTTDGKVEDARAAYKHGATEVDMVINVGKLLNGEHGAVQRDIEAVVDAVPLTVKTILETPLLEDGQVRTACEIAEAAGADIVKNTTGFLQDLRDAEGYEETAQAADIRIMSEYLPAKASGVLTWETACEMVEAGAVRIGTGAGAQIIETGRALAE